MIRDAIVGRILFGLLYGMTYSLIISITIGVSSLARSPGFIRVVLAGGVAAGLAAANERFRQGTVIVRIGIIVGAPFLRTKVILLQGTRLDSPRG